MKIKLVKHNKNGKEEIISRFFMKKNKIMSNPKKAIKVLEPIKNWKDGKPEELLTIKDGLKYLENLPYTFRTPYCMAIVEK